MFLSLISFQFFSEICAGINCGPNKICKVLKGKAKCQCPVISDCSYKPALVCGSDGTEYPNECLMKVKSCRSSSRGGAGGLVQLSNRGKCGKMSSDASFSYVITSYVLCCLSKLDYGTASLTVRRQAFGFLQDAVLLICDLSITVRDYNGNNPCRDLWFRLGLHRLAPIVISLTLLAFCVSGGGCSLIQCPKYSVCRNLPDGTPTCDCPKRADCTGSVRPVCGSDGTTYINECLMKVIACETKKNTVKRKDGLCGKSFYKVLSNAQALNPISVNFWLPWIF